MQKAIDHGSHLARLERKAHEALHQSHIAECIPRPRGEFGVVVFDGRLRAPGSLHDDIVDDKEDDEDKIEKARADIRKLTKALKPFREAIKAETAAKEVDAAVAKAAKEAADAAAALCRQFGRSTTDILTAKPHVAHHRDCLLECRRQVAVRRCRQRP